MTDALPYLSLDKCTVHYVQDESQAHSACREILASRPPNRMIVAGFDLEWPFQPRDQRVSLMQICLSEIGAVQCVIDLLNNDRLLLTGVALLHDVQKLASDYSFRLTHRFEKHTNKYVELKKLANWFYDTKNNWGLDGLLQQTCKHRLRKEKKFPRLSDWAACPLHIEQVEYAAADALAGLLIYEHMRHLSLHRLHDDVSPTHIVPVTDHFTHVPCVRTWG